MKTGWIYQMHGMSEESDISLAKMSIHGFAKKIQIISNLGLITDRKTYKEASKELLKGFTGNANRGKSPMFTIFSNESLNIQFYQEIEEALGIKLPKEFIEDLEQERQEGTKLDFKENENLGRKDVTSYRDRAYSSILNKLLEHCLEPYREKYLRPIMEEYISQYQDLRQDFLQLSPEERENQLQNLAASLNEELFSNDKISQIFFDKLQGAGLLTEDDKKAISVVLQQRDINSIKSEDMRKFIELHRDGISDVALVSRILSKKIEDERLYGKKITELTEDEKLILEYKIEDLSVKSKNGYAIRIPRTKFQDNETVKALGQVAPIICIYTDESELLLSDRFRGIEHFNTNVNGDYETNFTTIQNTETIGEYLSRMQTCIELINRQISGEDISFNPDGTQQENRETSQAIQKLTMDKNIRISEINAVTSEMRKDLTPTQQQQMETE